MKKTKEILESFYGILDLNTKQGLEIAQALDHAIDCVEIFEEVY